MDQGRFQVVVSTIVLAEVLVKPFRLEQWELAKEYESIFESIPHLSLIPVDRSIARTAAKFRATCSLLTPDAIHLATAVSCNADFLLTNDRDFHKIKTLDLPFPELLFINDL
jgi:predicted nucleic acid-binding protein